MPLVARRISAVLTASAALIAFGGWYVVAARAGMHAEVDDPLFTNVRASFATDLDSLNGALANFAHEVQSGADGAERRAAYRRARRAYKHAEGWLEFYSPAAAAALNSTRRDIEDDDAPLPSSLARAGFPALERLLADTPPRDDSLILVTLAMRPAIANTARQLASLSISEAQILELARMEIARVATLGISGFDARRGDADIPENASALDGIRDVLRAAARRHWTTTARREALARACVLLDSASANLRAARSFDTFNRLAFIVAYEEPAARAVDALRRVIDAAAIRIPRPWRVDAASVYEANAFDPRAYAPSAVPPDAPALVALGRALFNDRRLSGNGARTCATCHDPARAFTDGVARHASLRDPGSRVARNTPTLLNAALQPVQFDDARAATLEDQIVAVLASPAEMGSSVDAATARVAADPSDRWRFSMAFADSARPGVTPLRLRLALAAYVRSLTRLRSPFDRAVQGDTLAMSAGQRRGFTIFMGRAGCGTCHYPPLFSGVLPPLYLDDEAEVIGAPASRQGASVDADSGRMRIDHRPEHLYAFKTPSLRNVAVTAPYMHNGVFTTLDDVIAFYVHGGAVGAGANLPNQTLPPDSLRLSPRDRQDLVAFLRALTDTATVQR